MNLCLRRMVPLAIGLPAFSSPLPAQPCYPPSCNGNVLGNVLCDHHNRILNHGPGSVPIQGPNAATGNLAGDAEWKIFGCEHATTRASGSWTLVGWSLGLANLPANNPANGTALFQLPVLEVRQVTLNAAGQRIPDLNSAPLFTDTPGNALLVQGYGGVVHSISTSVWGPPGCGPNPGLPVLPSEDVALVFRYPPLQTMPPTPGQVYLSPTVTITEMNFALNTGANGAPSSYSGWIDASTNPPTIVVRPPNEELGAAIAIYEPTLEAFKSGSGFPLAPGSGARNLLPFENLVFWSHDWAAGERAVLGQSRVTIVLLGDPSAGSPLCPGGALLPGSLFFPGSPGGLSLHWTVATLLMLPWSLTSGLGMQCPFFTGECLPSGNPFLTSTMHSETAPIPIPVGIPPGSRLYAAAFYLNLNTLLVEDGSNTIELVFL